MVSMHLGETAPWLTGAGPRAGVAICSQCSLLRNVAGFAFPESCRDDERRSVEEGIVGVLNSGPPFEADRYYRMAELAPEEALMLAERRAIPVNALGHDSRGGVYVSADQSLSIAVNGWDHLCMTVSGPGLGVRGLWRRLNELDDALANQLDYAFDASLGYLTTSLRHVGTGLKASVLLHLPCLGLVNRLSAMAQMAQERRQVLFGVRPAVEAAAALAVPVGRSAGEKHEAMPRGVRGREALYYDLTEALYGDVTDARGDLYVLTNGATLGVSEQEIVFHLHGTAAEIVDRETQARGALVAEEPRLLEDRVARALAIAGSTRLLGFGEAMELLSSVRLAVSAGLGHRHTLPQLDQLLMSSQSAHLRAMLGRECDEGELSVARADLFRARFG